MSISQRNRNVVALLLALAAGLLTYGMLFDTVAALPALLLASALAVGTLLWVRHLEKRPAATPPGVDDFLDHPETGERRERPTR